MAPLSSLHSQHLRPHRSPARTTSTGYKKTQNPNVVCCKINQNDQDLCLGIEEPSLKIQRRDLLLDTVFASLVLPAIVPLAYAEEVVPDGFRIYSDDINKFDIMIPQDWQIGEGEGNGLKSITAFYPSEISNSNVTIVITGLSPDFTKLESFGKVDAFAENLVSGLDRSWQRPPGVIAKLINSKASKGLYYIEYSLRNPGESERHLYSVLGIANNGWYNRLYTLTGQYVDEEAEKYRSQIEKGLQTSLAAATAFLIAHHIHVA